MSLNNKYKENANTRKISETSLSSTKREWPNHDIKKGKYEHIHYFLFEADFGIIWKCKNYTIIINSVFNYKSEREELSH